MILKNLFQPKYKHPNPEVRRKAVMKIKDQNLLVQIVKEDKDTGVRMAALERISDQALLTDIGANVTRYDIAKAAIPKMDDVEGVKKVLYNAINTSARIAALHRLSGLQMKKEDLTQIAKETALNAKHESLRSTAMEYLEDPSVLKEIATKDSFVMNRIRAAAKLKDDEMLAGFLRDESNKVGRKINLGVCTLIIKNISDESLLADVAKNNPVFEIRKAAEEKVLSETLLQEIGLTKRERYAAYTIWYVMKLDDLDKELDVALYGTKTDVRVKAIDSIYSRYGTGKITGRKAFMPIRVKSLLTEASMNDQDPAIREYLSETLKDYPSGAK